MASSQKRHEPWRSAERHYCPLCNAWMGSDKQSIAIHENGKKHREAAEADLQQRRQDKIRNEKDRDDLAASLRAIEKAAGAALAKDVAGGAFSHPHHQQQQQHAAYQHAPQQQQVAVKPAVGASAAAPPPVAPAKSDAQHAAKSDEMDSWHARKRRRTEGGAAAAGDGGAANDGSSKTTTTTKKKKVRKLTEDEGHYKVGDVTYLEGPVYAPIFEEEMPAQVWIGDDDDESTASEADKRRVDRRHLWKTGLIVRVRRKGNGGGGGGEERIAVDVAYLRSPADDDETLERSVRPDRIRLVLGSDAMLPSTVEEARLELMGGEEVIDVVDGGQSSAAEIDENTGLTSWGTVSITRKTENKALKEERARLRAKRREDAERERQKEREEQERRMEEAKVANADDSALGSYDVWTGGKSGYKGVDIHSDAKVDVADSAKSLAKGKGAVAFKKSGNGGGGSMFKKAKKKQNRRVTSADDD